jgi:hypothetical protein
MRAAVLAVSLLALPSLARADVVTTLGISLDARATGPTFEKAGDSQVNAILGGGRLTMSFESAPLAAPPPGLYVRDARIVPELLAGFVADDTHAEGYVGAGARLELRIASMRHERLWRGGFYLAGRGLLVGGHQDGGIELALGSYLTTERGTRIGWESAAIMRPRHDATADQARELDALVTLYVGR